MNKEEAIKNIKKQLKSMKEANECGLATRGEFNKDIEAIETVLNLLEKKDKEIQFQKEINKTEQDRHKQTEKSLKEQIAKKNNILDKLVSCVPLSIYDFDTNKTYKGRECINFIERKVEEDK